VKLLPKWWRTNFLRIEFGVALFCGLVFISWAQFYGGGTTIEETLKGNRGAVYGALASIFGSLLGFAITAVSIVLGFSTTERLAVVRESKHYPTLWKVFTATIRTLGLATVIALFGLILDRDSSPTKPVLYLTVFATILATLRLGRCVWALENVISLITGPSKVRQGSEG
jgi:hypothetical protein